MTATIRTRIMPRTTFCTPLQADTLWGHLVINYGYRYGQDKLKELLARFETDPPFLVSDGFPRGYLPRPRLSLSGEKISGLVELVEEQFDDVPAQLVVSQMLGHFRKSQFISFQLLADNIDDLSMEKIAQYIITDALKPLDQLDPRKLDESLRDYTIVDSLCYDPDVWRPDIKLKTTETIKNSINRLTGSSRKMWGQEEIYWPDGFDIYFKVFDDSYRDLIEELLQDLQMSGYGSNKSNGKGHFEIESIEEIDLPAPAQANAFVSLSSFVPEQGDPLDGNYGIRVKRGKIGEGFPGKISPFKRPALMLETGSTFNVENPDHYYGSLLDNIHFNPEIRHYAYCFPLYVRLTNENGGTD
ncbi:MAG: type III-A CRISPR-associated RAMP protein Csm4 [bacterium]